MEPKCSKYALSSTAVSKCGLRVATGSVRDAKVFQKVVKRCPKHVPGHPGGGLFDIGIYHVKPTFA